MQALETGWGVACKRLGIKEKGVELMAEAVATREANGMETIYRDVWDGLLREEAEIYLSTQSASALIVVPGEEGLYPGKVITVHTTGETLTAETGGWVYSQP